MVDKKLKLLIILSIVAAISVVYGMLSPTKFQKAAKKRAKSVLRNVASETVAEKAGTGRRRARSAFESWGRNPFKQRDSGAEAVSSIDLRLNGIVYKQNNPKAMINDNIVGVGHKIGGCTVIDIKPDRVVVNDGTRDITLRLEE